jgi:hypothetical protein
MRFPNLQPSHLLHFLNSFSKTSNFFQHKQLTKFAKKACTKLFHFFFIYICSRGFGGRPVVAMVPPNSQKKKKLGCIYIYIFFFNSGPLPFFFSLLWSLSTLHPGSVPVFTQEEEGDYYFCMKRSIIYDIKV